MEGRYRPRDDTGTGRPRLVHGSCFFSGTMGEQIAEMENSSPSLAGELSDLLIELAAGLRRAFVYGANHPRVLEAASSFVSRNSGRRDYRGTLSIVSAGTHLIVEIRPVVRLTRRLGGIATGLDHPLLAALAERLATHEVGALDLAEGVTSQEIAAILGFLASDVASTGRPLGREDEAALSSLPNIRIHRNEWTQTVAPADDESTPRDPEENQRLWSAFARAALGIPDVERERPYPPSEVAAAISARADNPEFEQRIKAHILGISTSLGEANPLESADLAHRFSNVLRRLDRRTLHTVLSLRGDEGIPTSLLRDLAGALDVDIVLDLLQVAAEDEANDISRLMLRLLSKLARHAQAADGATASRSDLALREQIESLLTDWSLEDPTPDDYDDVLSRISSASDSIPEASASRHLVEPERIVATALEVEIDSRTVRSAADEMIRDRKYSMLVDYLQSAPEGELSSSLWKRLTNRAVLERLIQEAEPDWDLVDRLLPHAGLQAAEPLLDRLADADTLAIRRRLFDVLLELGPGIGEPAVNCLGSPETTPWYVIRNVVSLLSMLDSVPADFDPWYLVDHENPQVRIEVIKLCFRLPARREQAIMAALQDASSRIVALGIVEAETECPSEAEAFLRRVAESNGDSEYSEFRTHAIRALTRLGSPAALETLLGLTARRRWRLRRRLPADGPVFRAALSGLASAWPDDPRVGDVLERVRNSGFADVVSDEQ